MEKNVNDWLNRCMVVSNITFTRRMVYIGETSEVETVLPWCREIGKSVPLYWTSDGEIPSFPLQIPLCLDVEVQVERKPVRRWR